MAGEAAEVLGAAPAGARVRVPAATAPRQARVRAAVPALAEVSPQRPVLRIRWHPPPLRGLALTAGLFPTRLAAVLPQGAALGQQGVLALEVEPAEPEVGAAEQRARDAP